MSTTSGKRTQVARFLDAWLATRQLIQAANFNRFQNAGLSATQFMTLNLIPANDGEMTLTELARRMNLAAPTVTKTIDSLEDRGLVTRTRSEDDRRRVLLALTPAGMALQNAASADFHERMASLFGRMSPAERGGLVVGLEGLIDAAARSNGITRAVRSPGRSSARSRPPRS